MRDADEDLPGDEPRARLLVGPALEPGARIALDREQAHYIARVLRIGPGGVLALFNGRDGEWTGRVEAVGRNTATVALVERRRPQHASPDTWLLFAPLRRSRTDLVVEKATELGASAILPVVSAHARSGRANLDRWRAIAREAAEQCERLDLPAIEPPVPLEERLAAWPEGRPLYVCDEQGRGLEPAEAFRGVARGRAAALLVGPEGGFAAAELDRLSQFHFVTRIHLGPRILRAETAAIVALAMVQAWLGDWSERPPGRLAAEPGSSSQRTGS